MIKDGLAVVRQMFIEPDRAPLGPAEQNLEPPLALDQRQVAQEVGVLPEQVEGVPRRLRAPVWFRSAWKSGVPSSRAITASPSIRNDCALMRSAASTMAGKRSAQSWPPR